MCWLCAFQSNELAIQLNTFIVTHIGYMELACISQQVSDGLLVEFVDAPGASKDDVYTHIISHMLHPRVRTAVMLRQLLDFAGLLQSNMVVREGTLCTVDKGNAELYLKVIGQILAMYKVDPTTMLFSEDPTALRLPLGKANGQASC